MSLKPNRIDPVPELTARVAHAAFTNSNPYLTIRDELGTLFDDEQFADLFPARGKPAFAPWRLALITLLQFAEGLSDRQAADAVRSRIDWKYALSLELEDSGFDASILCEFRARLLEGEAEERLFETLLNLLRDRNLLKARGRQRTDSTHILAAVRAINRIELVAETLRHALDSLATLAPDFLQQWLTTHVQPEQIQKWVQRYSHRIENNRLPVKEEERKAFVREVGIDGMKLLSAIYGTATYGTGIETTLWLRAVPAVEMLRRVWMQNYYQSNETETGIVWREADNIAPARRFISSPLDADAHLAKKGSTCWVGYKVHLTETCDDDLPPLITHVATTAGPAADGEVTPKVHQDLQAKDLLPETHIVDTGFLDAELLVMSKQNYAVDLLGPTRPNWRWKARVDEGFGMQHFQINWEKKQAVCPEGMTSLEWMPKIDDRGNNVVYIRFSAKDCGRCKSRSLCFPSEKQPVRRSITVRPQGQYEALNAARVRETTKEYAQEYARRAGIEGTISRGIRTCEMRRSRYVGHGKVHLGDLLAATAMNFLRLGEWLSGMPRSKTRVSPFARMMTSPAPA